MILFIQNSYNCDGLGSWFWWLIGAFLLGAILGWLLRCIFGDCGSNDTNTNLSDEWKAKYETSLNDQRELQAKLDACNKARNAASAVAAATTAMAITPAFVKPEDRDDLKKIEGIGPKIEQLLFDGNIFTWEGLSKTAVNTIQEILDKAGPRYRVHNPASWPLQGKMAAEGKWDELNKWQDEHKGGLL
jgi:predicted flap endonuclease-1-like 5' DNA nuclease